MDKKPSKCRFRVMKFDENAVYSSNYETSPGSAPKSAKGFPGSAPRLLRRRASKGPIKGPYTKQNTKKKVLSKRNTITSITDGLKRIFSSTNHPELNNVCGARQAIKKVKKTKKIVKDKIKESYSPDYFRRYEDTVTYQCETNKYPLKGRNEPCLTSRDRERLKSYSHELENIPNRIQRKPSTYFLPAGDSKEGELCKYKPPYEPKTSYESCDCLPVEITYPRILRHECAKYCSMRRVEEGRSFPICHCSSINLRPPDLRLQMTKKKCKCCPNKSGIPKHPTSITQTLNSTNTHVDVKTSPVAIVQKNAVCGCPSSNSNNIRRTSEKTTQRSKTLGTCTYASTKCSCSAQANDSRNNVTCKSPSWNTNSRPSNELSNFRSCECMNSVHSNSSRHSRKKAACVCLSSNFAFIGRSLRTAGIGTQCFTKPTTVSVSCNPSQSIKCASNMSNLNSSCNAQKVTQCTDAPPTCPATICCVNSVDVESSSSVAPDTLSYSALCAFSKTDQRANPTTLPVTYAGVKKSLCRPPQNTKCNTCNTSCLSFKCNNSCYKCLKTTQCPDAPSAGNCVSIPPRITSVSCGSFSAVQIAHVGTHCGSSLTLAPKGIDIKTSCRLRRKSCRHKSKTGICSSIKKMTKCCKMIKVVPCRARLCRCVLKKLFNPGKSHKCAHCGDAQQPPPKCRAKCSSCSRKKPSSCRLMRPVCQPRRQPSCQCGNTLQLTEITQQSACRSTPHEECKKCARACSRSRKPHKQIEKSKCTKARTCKAKEIIVLLLTTTYRKVVGLCHCENKEPKLSCEDLTTIPPPPFLLNYPYLFARPFGLTCDGNRSNFSLYNLCAFVVAAIFWCPLAMCLFVFYRCFRCYS